MPSVMQRMIHSTVSGHDDGWSAINMSSGTASSSRRMVTALAGVASADGPNDVSESVTSGRLEVGAECRGDGQGRERTRVEIGGNGDDAVDLRRLPMGPPDPRFIHEHFDLRTDQIVTFRRRDPVLLLA